MKEAVNFLTKVFDRSVEDLAVILTAQAQKNNVCILEYLMGVKGYVEDLIEQVKSE